MNIYFSGIGGVGIGPLAEIAFAAGYEVTGSDIEKSLMTDSLEKKGIKISLDQSGAFLQEQNHKQKIDWLIYTSALPKNHPELKLATDLGIPIAKRDELLSYIIKSKNLKMIAVAGTHGKTTTTGMLIWVMTQLNIPISYSIGTTMNFGKSGHFDSVSQYFVYECDEFDRNFLHYKPYLSLFTSIDYDHPDTFPTVDSYVEAFKSFAKQSQFSIGWQNQHAEIFNPQSSLLLDPSDDFKVKLVGSHNRRNAKLVEEALIKLGLASRAKIRKALASFPGTDRRFEKLANNLYSDYGHHPVEIAATLELARELSDHVVLVYQPHQNLRQYEIKKDYTNQFEKADKIYLLAANLPIA